ncbi:MAG: ATP-dependent RecD-like DNA helicase, partial [bacterium]|nr:ATP-dependent RecD-like DNA helicase [bacterium]
KRLVEHFGSAVLDVIGEEPERLREIPGVGQVRSGRIARAWQDQRKVREVMLFLHSHGIGAQRAVRIQKIYGEQTLETLRRDPYRLVRDVRGVGFATADALARSLGFEPEAESRVRAGIRQILRDALAQGHCGRPHALVIESAAKLLGISRDRVTLSSRDLVDEEELEEDTVEGETALFLPEL